MMQKIINWGIVAGIVFIIFLLSPFSPICPHWRDLPAPEVREDSVKISKATIKAIQARERDLVERIEQYSAERAESDKTHQETIARLERKIRAINLKRASTRQLDSIRAVLFPDGTDIDSTYAMPLQLAREALQAHGQAPLKDSVIREQKARISQQDAELATTVADYKSLDSIRVATIEEQGVIIRNDEAMLQDCRRKNKRGFRKWIEDVGKVGLGFLIGNTVR